VTEDELLRAYGVDARLADERLRPSDEGEAPIEWPAERPHDELVEEYAEAVA
jgi:hypothetical protein